MKQGSPPHYSDVDREVRRLLPSTPDQENDDAYRKFRKLVESAQSEYKKAHQMLEEGELEGLLAATDKQRVRLMRAIGKFVDLLNGDAETLREGQKIDEDYSI
jgi:uncharacterized caspase-like protein